MKFTIKQSLILGSTLLFLSLIFGYAGAWLYNCNVLNRASHGLQIAGDVSMDRSGVRAISANGDMPSGFEQASASATPSVVFIKTVSTVQYDSPLSGLFWDFDPFGSRGQAASTGSGVIVSKDGYIVTNNHVIQGADKITVVLNKPKNEYTARVIGTDPSSDLAVLKIEANDLPAVAFANSDLVKVGEWVLAVGNPFNLTSTVTAGIVSAKGRNINLVKNQFPIESFIQTDAAINPGNSGGALVNLRGELVGINTAIQSNTGSYSGYGFAIPANIVMKVVADLMDNGVVLRAFSGMTVGEASADELKRYGLSNDAVKVTELIEDGPAYKSGLRLGDVITHLGGMPVDGKPMFDEHLAYKRPGQALELQYLREGKSVKAELLLIGTTENQALLMKGAVNSKLLGADFQPLGASDLQKYGLTSGIRLINIQRGKTIAQMGLGEGFVVVKFNGKSYAEPEDLISAMEAARGRIEIVGKDRNGSNQSFSFYSY
jgi:Do/DeqQ family serine protease